MNNVPFFAEAASSDGLVVRPIWRRFAQRFAEGAAAWVRAGGLAAIAYEEKRLVAWLGAADDGRLLPFAEWALASIDAVALAAPLESGPAAGLFHAPLDEDSSLTVLDWCERDAVHPGPTRAMRLDCIACTACCQDAFVVVEDADRERFRSNGRPELAEEPCLQRAADGTLHLRFVGRHCANLEAAGTCAIYAMRPSNCRAFLPGSEPCLAAREDTLDVRDDAPDATSGDEEERA